MPSSPTFASPDRPSTLFSTHSSSRRRTGIPRRATLATWGLAGTLSLALASSPAAVATPLASSGSNVSPTPLTSLAASSAATSDWGSQIRMTAEQLRAEIQRYLDGAGIPLELPPIPGGSEPSPESPGNPGHSAPKLVVAPTTGLTDGSVVTIHGSGYVPGKAVYITQTIERPAAGYPRTYGEAVKVTPDSSGSFSTSLPVATSFSGVDCRRTSCYVASFTAFPNLADRSQDVWVPISFSGAASPRPSTPGTPSRPSQPGAPARPSQPSAPGAPASNGPTVRVSKTTNLNPGGDTVTVTGRGFSTSGPGIYVGIAQDNQFSTTNQSAFGPDTVWVSRQRGTLKADGTFSITLKVQARFGSANCMTNTCSIYTFAAHGSSDRSQDTATPVGFAGGVAPARRGTLPQNSGSAGSGSSGGGSRSGGTGARGAASAPTPTSSTNGDVSVSVSPTTIAATGVTPVTVSGTGFSTDSPGIYVAVAEMDKFSSVDASAFGAAAYVRTSEMGSDGSFSTTLDVEAVFPAGNCIDNECAVFTFAAHGSSDRSQDTATTLTVAGTEAEKEQARAEAKRLAKKAAEKDAKKKATKKATTPGEDSAESSSEREQAVAATSSTSPLGLFGAGVVGALAGGLLVAGGYLLGRRRTTAGSGSSAETSAEE